LFRSFPGTFSYAEREWSGPLPLPACAYQADDPPGQNDHKDADRTLKEKAIRQNQDHRIGARIKQPVIVPKQDCVEDGEYAIPLKDSQKSQSQGNQDGQTSGNVKASARMLSAKGADQGKNPCHKAHRLHHIKDPLAIRKMNSSSIPSAFLFLPKQKT
jgi:hypothetical protein